MSEARPGLRPLDDALAELLGFASVLPEVETVATFDADGHVTHGPAKKDLPSLTMLPNEQGELLVTLPGS